MSNMICDECETVAHCLKNGCIPKQPAQQDSDCVLVPRVLIGAACSAIDRKRDAPETLKQLRRYTVGDLSTTQPSQPQQEPAAWMTQARNFVHPMEFTEEEAKSYGWKAVYTAPPARKPLTDKELEEIVKRGAENKPFHHWFARAIEAAHGIKENT